MNIEDIELNFEYKGIKVCIFGACLSQGDRWIGIARFPEQGYFSDGCFSSLQKAYDALIKTIDEEIKE